MTKNNITTIEGLAEMIQRTMASKEDVHALDTKVQALDTKVTAGFERIEHLLLEEQRRKIENLETRMQNSKTPSPASRRTGPLNQAAPRSATEWRLFYAWRPREA